MAKKRPTITIPSKLAVDCQLKTISAMVFSSKLDLSEYNFYVVRLILVIGGKHFTFNEDIWDGELSWNFYGEPDDFTVAVEGDLRLEIEAGLADVFNGVPVAEAALEIEFRIDGDSPAVKRSSCKVIEKGTFKLLNLRTAELD